MLDFNRLKQPWGGRITSLGQRSAQSAEDIGRQRSGADFKNQSDFVITSALLRLLGAQEQFERDVLKALLYYRPSARSGNSNDYDEIEVEESVVAELGTRDGDKVIYSKPAIWTWISRQSENNVERHKIFSNVFGISCLPSKEDNALSKRLYEMRNQVAHGRAGVHMTLGEYQEAEFHVFRCILHMRDECMAKATLHKEIEMMASDYDDVVIDGPPQSWTPYFHGTRCFPFRKFPYGLIYVELPDNIVGLAICHFRRRPGY